MNTLRFIVNHWAQITLIIMGIAFFIGEFYKMHLRRKEAKSIKLFERRLIYIDDFAQTLFRFQKSMNDLPQDVFLKKITMPDLDKNTTTILRDLQYKDYFIYLHFSDKTYKAFNSITKKSEILLFSLKQIISGDITYIDSSNKFDEIMRSYNKEINNLIKESIKLARKELS